MYSNVNSALQIFQYQRKKKIKVWNNVWYELISKILNVNIKTMKTLLAHSFILLALLFFSACTETVVGPQGPRGPQGNDGAQGIPGESSGIVFEFDGIDFTAGNDYSVFLNYPENFDGLVTDVALVYFLWEVQQVNGEDVEIWRLLPQNVLYGDGGILQYNFDFTASDARVFLQANFPLGELGAADTDDWVARVVIVPGDFWDNGRVDVSDYNNVKEMLGLPEIDRDYSNTPVRKK